MAPLAAAQQSGWIPTPSSDDLENSRVVTTQGTAVGDACEYSLQLEISPAKPELAAQEVADNPSTCQARIEIGTSTEDPSSQVTMSHRSHHARHSEPRTLAAEDGDAWRFDEGSGDAGDDGIPEVLRPRSQSAAIFRTWFEDPPGFDVNKVSNHVQWKYNGNCVVGTVFWNVGYNWLSGTGWTLDNKDVNVEANCSHARISVFASYGNFKFCPTGGTRVTYDRNRIWGKPNGNIAGDLDWVKSGSCTGALSVHQDLHYTDLFH
jgi:hypothetical protein